MASIVFKNLKFLTSGKQNLKNGNPKGVKFKNESNINYVSTVELL
jgi:hypothetical protein